MAELTAVVFGLLSVWFMKKEHILVFPFGIINVLIYVYICYTQKLYAYASINVFYFLMSVYGWYNWLRKSEGDSVVRVSRCGYREMILYGVALITFFLILRWLLVRFTDSVLPSIDAFTTAVYIIGQWLLTRKRIENWLFWIAGDILSIGLFAYQELYFSSLQFLVFTIIATLGYLEWRKKLVP
jgi:nicotinamide mononucleotide transporter